MRKALINYVNFCAKGDFCRFQDPQALCVCVAAAAGAFFSWKNTSLDCWTMYFVDCCLFLSILGLNLSMRIAKGCKQMPGQPLCEYANCEKFVPDGE